MIYVTCLLDYVPNCCPHHHSCYNNILLRYVRITVSSSITVFVFMMCLHLFRKFIWCRLSILLEICPYCDWSLRGKERWETEVWTLWGFLEVFGSILKSASVAGSWEQWKHVVTMWSFLEAFIEHLSNQVAKLEARCQFPLHCNLEDCCKLLPWTVHACEGWEKLSQVEPQQWWQVRQDNSQLSDTFGLVQSQPIAGALRAGMLAGIDHDVQAWSLAAGSNTCLYVVDRNGVVLLSILVKYGMV